MDERPGGLRGPVAVEGIDTGLQNRASTGAKDLA